MNYFYCAVSEKDELGNRTNLPIAKVISFDVLLTVHLSIILVINQLYAQILVLS